MNTAVSVPIAATSKFEADQSLHDILVYLEILYDNVPETSLIGLTTNKKGQAQFETFFFKPNDTKRLVHRIATLEDKYNTYLRVTPLIEKPEKGRGIESQSAGSNVLWLDVDNYDQIAAIEKLQSLDKPPTLIVNSGHGIHAYWRLTTFVTDLPKIKSKNKGIARLLGIDKADNVFDLARIMRVPGSWNVKNGHPLQATIRFIDKTRIYSIDDFASVPITSNDHPIYEWEVDELPLDFLDTLRDRDKKLYQRIFSEATARKTDALTTSDGAIDCSRNDAYIAIRMLALGYSSSTVMAVLMHDTWLSGEKYQRTHQFNYVLNTANYALDKYQQAPDQFFNGKTFRAKLMAEHVEKLYPFIYTAQTLYRYFDGVYLPDGQRVVSQYIQGRLGERWSTYLSNEAIQWLNQKYDTPLDQVIAQTKEFRGFVNCSNGMVNAITGAVLPHDQKYLSFHRIPVEYDPNANTAAIDSFISQIMPEDAVNVFWEYVGSVFIQDEYWPKAFVALVGLPNSGKSKLLGMLYRFFGGSQNCAAISFQALMDQRFTTAHLFGKIANIFSDIDESEAQNVGKIKGLTGDDIFTAEQKYKDMFEFKNTARLFFSANNYPIVKGPDNAYFNRAYIIPCNNVFIDGETAKEFILDNICTTANFSAVLLRSIQGLQRLLSQHRFSFSQSIQDARSEYRYSADTVLGFFNAMTTEDDTTAGFIIKDTIYSQYKQWCSQGGRRHFSEDKFYKRIADSLVLLKIQSHYLTVDGGMRKHGWKGRRYLSENERFEFN